MNQKPALLTLVMLAMTAHAGSALAALPNFSATCPTDIRVKSQGGNVFINGKKATLKTLAPAAYSATNGKVVIGITFDLPASEPTLDYVIKHDRRAHGFCTVHAWSAGKAAALPMAKGDSPYQGKWVAKNRETGATVANIQVDGKEQVWVNGVKVKAKRADGALQFRQGHSLYPAGGSAHSR